MAASMVHWNGNQCCAIDTETTGLDPNIHEVVQIAVVALDSNFKMRRDVGLPLVIKIQPEFPENADPKALQVNGLTIPDLMANGYPKDTAIAILVQWLTKLDLEVTRGGKRKRVIPLGHNYDFDKSFIQRWIGQPMYDEWFDYEIRDTKRVVAYINDRAAMKGKDIPFPHTGLGRIAFRLGIDNTGAHDALADCIMTAKVYRMLMNYHFGMWS